LNTARPVNLQYIFATQQKQCVLQAGCKGRGKGKGCTVLGSGTMALSPAQGRDKQGSARADRKHLEKSDLVSKVAALPARNGFNVVSGEKS